MIQQTKNIRINYLKKKTWVTNDSVKYHASSTLNLPEEDDEKTSSHSDSGR